MQNLTQPTLLLKPFAQNGTKNTIPNVNTDASNPQLADLTNGFPAIVSLDPNDGGLPPERADFNGLGYLTTSYDYFYQAGGTFTYNATIATAIGGYPLNARLWYTDSSGTSMILRSTIANNTNNFLTDSSVIGEPGENKPWVIENFRGIRTQWDLFDNKWTDYQLSNQSWLRADTFSWNSGSVYSDAYNHLVADISGVNSTTETVGSYTITYYPASDGHKIIMPNQETTATNIYNESGVAWYYILDTTNTRFKLPRMNPDRMKAIQTLKVKGNGTAVGLTNGTSNAGMVNISTSSIGIIGKTDYYGASVSSSTVATGNYALGTIGITEDATKSGIIANTTDSVSTYSGNKYHYFYIGQFSTTATEQTAGLNSSLFNGKADIDLMNITASAKLLLCGLLVPDWANKVSISSGYTATTVGWLVWQDRINRSDKWVAIDGVQIANSYGQTGDWADSAQAQILVGVGQVITYSMSDNGFCYFVPCKGL